MSNPRSWLLNFSTFFIAAKVLTINRRLPPECMRSVHGKKRRFKDKRKRRAKRGDIAAAEMDLQGGLVRGASNGGGRHEQSWADVTISSGIEHWTTQKHTEQVPSALDRITENTGDRVSFCLLSQYHGAHRTPNVLRGACNFCSRVRFSGQPGRSAHPAPCLAFPAPEVYAQSPFCIRTSPSHAHPTHAPLRILERLRSVWMCLLSQVHPAHAHGRRQKRMVCDRRVVARSLEVRAPHQPALR